MPNSRHASRANVHAVDPVADELLRLGTVDGQHPPVLVELADGECTEEEYRRYMQLSGLA